jgi:hypothetical protein
MTQPEIIAIIERILYEIATPGPFPEVEYQVVMDTVRHHYQVVVSGWRGLVRTYGILVHIDLKGDLVWVQEDNTEYRVVDELVKSGIAKQQIVIGFHAPYKRPLGEFATGE